MSATDIPILEFTKLKRLDTTPPPTDENILVSLIEVRSRLASQVHPTKSTFHDAGDQSSIFIFGFWPTVQAHEDFLASDKCHDILAPQEGLLSFHEGHHWRCVKSVAVKGGTRYRGSLERPMVMDVLPWFWMVALEVRGTQEKAMLEKLEQIVLEEAGKKDERVVFDTFAGADEGKGDERLVLIMLESKTTASGCVDGFKDWARKELTGESETTTFEIWMLRNLESGST